VVYAPGAAAGEIALGEIEQARSLLACRHPPRGGRQCHPFRPLEGLRPRPSPPRR
jgi:hypothetical protein